VAIARAVIGEPALPLADEPRPPPRPAPGDRTDESPAAWTAGLSLPGPGEAPDFSFYSRPGPFNTTSRVSNNSAFQPVQLPNGAVR
jgi:hypothetical protein